MGRSRDDIFFNGHYWVTHPYTVFSYLEQHSILQSSPDQRRTFPFSRQTKREDSHLVPIL